MLSLVAVFAESVVRLRQFISNQNDSSCSNELNETENQEINENGDNEAHPKETKAKYNTETKDNTADETEIQGECTTQVSLLSTTQHPHIQEHVDVNGSTMDESRQDLYPSDEAPAKTLAGKNQTDLTSSSSSFSPPDQQEENTCLESSERDIKGGANDHGVSDDVGGVSFIGRGFGFASTTWDELNNRRSKDTGMGRREVGGNESKIMVKNIPYKAKIYELRRFFGTFGKVADVYLLQEHLKNRSRSKGMAFVTFRSPDGVKKVMEATIQELTLRGRVMTIEYAEPKSFKKIGVNYKGSNTGVKNISSEQFEDATTLSDGEDSDDRVTSYDMSSDDALIHTLYDEILVRIFLLLELRDRITIERVCKRWHAVARASWQSVGSLTFTNIFKGLKFALDDSSSTAVGLTDQIFRSVLLRGCRSLLSLDLSASPHLLTYRSLELIGKRCTKLESLNLTGVSVTNATLGQLTKSCSKIKKIVLQRSFGVGEKGFWWLFHNCPKIEYIDIRESKRFRGKCFHIMNESCHTVIVSGCSRLDDAGIYELTTKCTSQLKCLDVSHCYHITDKSLRLIAQQCSQLTMLDLSGLVQGVTPAGLCSLAQLTELLELRISQNAAVNDEVLIKVGEKCKKLRFIDVSGCYEGVHDIGLQGLAGCSQLEVININYLDQLTDEGLKHLAVNCNQLTKISARACVLITDEVMLHIAYQCLRLEDLDVSGCEKLTNATLDTFFESRHGVDDDRVLHLTVGGTEVESTHASSVTSDSNGCLVVSLHNLAVSVKKFCTEAFFGSDDISDDEGDADEAVAAAEEDWADDYIGLPLEQFADADAEMEQFVNPNPVPAGHYERVGRGEARGAEENWDISDDFVNDYLDADDPSMWEEEEWMLS